MSGKSIKQPPTPGPLKVLSASVMDIVRGVQAVTSQCSYYVTKIRNKEPFNVQVHHLAQVCVCICPCVCMCVWVPV
jgi:hypothetical protein